MMEAFLGLLLATPDLTVLVDNRIAWRVQPPGQTVRPYVNLQVVGGLRGYSLDGPRRWKTVRAQVDVWASGGVEAKAVWEAIEDCLSGFSGEVSGVEFSMIRLEGERSRSDRGEDGMPVAGYSGDFSFRWRAVE